MDDRRQPGGATIVAAAGGGRRAAVNRVQALPTSIYFNNRYVCLALYGCMAGAAGCAASAEAGSSLRAEPRM